MKEIIDKHFTDRYEYYRKVCRVQFQGRYLWEDLFQETYLRLLTIKPETIEFYNDIDKLNCIVIRTIKSLYQERKRGKKNKQGSTSPLFEIHGVDIEVAYEMDFDNLNPMEIERWEQMIQKQYSMAKELIAIALSEPVTDGEVLSDFAKVKAFTLVRDSNINKVSKETNISRPYLTSIYRQGQQLLAKQINERSNTTLP